MPKIYQNQFEEYFKKPWPTVRALLIYGNDRGLIMENFDRMTQHLFPDLDDPFRLVTFDWESVQNTPETILDEALSISFLQEPKLIRIKDATDSAAILLKEILAQTQIDSFFLVTAESLPPASSLRQLFEKTPNISVLACYSDDAQNLKKVIQGDSAKQGYAISPDALDYLTSHFGEDRATTRSELEKLFTYVGKKKEISLVDTLACIGDTSSLSLTDLVFYVSEGNIQQSFHILDRLLAENIYPVVIIRTLIKHFQNLYWTKRQLGEGKSFEAILSRIRPPIFFKYNTRFQEHSRKSDLMALGEVLELLLQAERDCKTTGMPAELMISQCLIYILSQNIQNHERSFE